MIADPRPVHTHHDDEDSASWGNTEECGSTTNSNEGSAVAAECCGTAVAQSGKKHTRGLPTDVPPCSHNAWTRSRRRRTLPGVRLRCVVCRALWVTVLEHHEKCSGFYSGKCEGDCGKPHIFARGTVPEAVYSNTGDVNPNAIRSLRACMEGMQQKSSKKRPGSAEGVPEEGASEPASAAASAAASAEASGAASTGSAAESDGAGEGSVARTWFYHDPYSMEGKRVVA